MGYLILPVDPGDDSVYAETMRAESREPRAESREPRAESREPRAESREPRAESREPRAESREPRAESREPRAESREPRAESSVHGEARRLDFPALTGEPPPKRHRPFRRRRAGGVRMSRSGCPRGGARRVRAERGPARRAAGVLPARSGRPSSGPGRSDRRRACGGVRAPSPGALPGRGLPGGGGRRPPGPARRGVGAGQFGPPVLVSHTLGPVGRRPVPADIRHVDAAATPRRPTSRSTTPSCRTARRRGTRPSGATARSSGWWGRRPRSMPATTRAPPGPGCRSTG